MAFLIAMAGALLGPRSLAALKDLIAKDRQRTRTYPQTRRGNAVVPIATPMLCKTDSSHAKGASGTVSIYSGTPGSETDTTENVTAFNKFANLGSGKWCWVESNGFGWYLVAGEC